MAGVYVVAHSLHDGWRGPCKIGISSSWACRVSSLQSGNPKPIGLFVFYDIGDRACAAQTERALHRIFSDKRLSGEWFQIDPNRAVCAIHFLIAKTVGEGARARGIEMDVGKFVADLSTGPGAFFRDTNLGGAA